MGCVAFERSVRFFKLGNKEAVFFSREDIESFRRLNNFDVFCAGLLDDFFQISAALVDWADEDTRDELW